MWKYLIFTLSESTLRAGWLSWVGVSSSSSRTAKKSLLAKVSNCIGLSSLFSERWPSLSYYTRARASLLRLLPSTKARKTCFLELVRQLDVALGCWNWAGRLAALVPPTWAPRARGAMCCWGLKRRKDSHLHCDPASRGLLLRGCCCHCTCISPSKATSRHGCI